MQATRCKPPRNPTSFAESDLKQANRGGARISATETAAILDRRTEIEGALRDIDSDATLTDTASSIPWAPLTQLFDSFADIRGVGFSKMTKALHPKRPALIPMLDSVVQAYLAGRIRGRDRRPRSATGRSRSTEATNASSIATVLPCTTPGGNSRAQDTVSPTCESSTW